MKLLQMLTKLIDTKASIKENVLSRVNLDNTYMHTRYLEK